MSLATAPTPASTLATAATATGHPATLSLLRMAVADLALAVPIDHVREILEVGRLTELPRTPDFVRGVMNLRGAVVPVVDLAARCGLGATTVRRRSCIVVVEAGGTEQEALVVGLLVDAVFEVFDTAGASVEPVPMLGTPVRADFLAGMTRAHGQVVAMLDLAHVLSPQDLAAAIDAWQPH
jgi:purine-binding chemotaxis protein CheW